jgi:outer membrane protein
MKMMKRLGLVVSTLILVGGVSSVSFAQAADNANFKVAIVNVQKVLQQSPRVVQLSKKLEAEFKPRQAKIDDGQKALQDELDNFKKEAPTMAQKDRDAMQKKIAGDRADLVKQVVAYQQDLQKEQTKIMQGVLTDLNNIVSNIAKAQSYSLVLDSQAVIYSATGNDITADVAKQFDSK